MTDLLAALADRIDPPDGHARGYFPGARAEQTPPAGVDWLTWLIIAGRGFGKTRTGAEWIVDQAIENPGTRWAAVGPTARDWRDVMIEGESGALSVLDRRGVRYRWNRSNGELVLENRSRIDCYAAETPERLRGPQFHGAWCDEPASWQYGPDAWAMLQFGLRLGQRPRVVVTGTPKPVALVRGLIERAVGGDASVAITRGRTLDNAANLAPTALAELERTYGGTRLGRQELEGELLTDTPGALWTYEALANGRVSEAPQMVRVVVAVDPSGGSGEHHDEQGIVIAGRGVDGHAYVLDDRSCSLSPDGWARRAVAAYHAHAADKIVAETNYGGDMVISTIRQADSFVPVVKITASRGKRQRAEPIALLYEQGRVHHVGRFDLLEDQMCTWVPESGDSPDRMDALVWALTDLMEGSNAEAYLSALMAEQATPAGPPESHPFL